MNRILPFVIIFLFGLYGIKLFIFHQLEFYVNQSNIWYISLGSIVCFIIGVLGFILNANKLVHTKNGQRTYSHITIIQALPFIPLVCALSLGFFLAPRPIASVNFTNIQPITPQLVGNGLNNEDISVILGYNTAKYQFQQWYDAEEISQNDQYFNGKPVDLIGQVYDQTQTSFYLARLYIWCCTVDARPFGFTVVYPLAKGSQIPFHNGDWVEVIGAFEQNNHYSQKLFIVPFEIKYVPSPTNPYVN